MATKDLDKIRDEMRQFVKEKVAAGFHTSASIIDWAVDNHCDDAEREVLRPITEALTREAVAAHVLDQATWPALTDCDRLDDGFAALNDSGIVCRQNFSCCTNCGISEIKYETAAEREEGRNVRGYAFYHMQDTERAMAGGRLYVHFDAVEESEEAGVGIGKEIYDALERHGLAASWNGQLSECVGILLDWKRRRPIFVTTN